MQRLGRMKHELSMLASSTMTGISAWTVDDDLFHLQAQIVGGDDSAYKGGVFKLEIRVPDRYPFEPPHVKFLTPIYHPNVDAGGRICLDVLKMPPKGNWRPSSNIRTVLLSIQLLMNEPNPDDPLMEDISQQYKSDRRLFRETAARWTQRHAVETKAAAATAAAKEDEGGKEKGVSGEKEREEKRREVRDIENARNPKTPVVDVVASTAASSTKVDDSIAPSVSAASDVGESLVSAEKKPSLSRAASTSNSRQPPLAVDSSTKNASFDDFDDIFHDDDDDDDDFVAKTPQKKRTTTTTTTRDSDSFSDMNDSDLDLFDFEESPVKKKKQLTDE